MKKNKSYELHQLILSLNPAEKKFIGRQLQKYDTAQNKAQLLFDCFNNVTVPDDAVLENAYRDNKYNSQYLAADKNKLYEDILHALSLLNDDYSNEIKANNGLQRAIVLYEKKLFDQCLKQISKTKKQAELFELWGLLISLLHLEQRCHRVLFDFDAAESAMLEEKTVFNKQKQLNLFANFHYQSIALRVKFSKARSEEQIGEFQELISSLEKLGKGNDFYTEFNRLETFCNYYYVKDDLQHEMHSNQELSSLMQRNLWYIEDNPLNYIAIRTRLLGILRRNAPEQFWKELPEFRKLPSSVLKQKMPAELNVFVFSHNFELDQLLLEKRWQEAFALIAPMEKGIEKFSAQIDANWLYSAYFRFSCAALYSLNYNKALDYILKTIHDFPPSLRPDLHDSAQLLQIIIHYGLGNLKLIPSLVSNARYQLRKNGRLFKTETLLLNSFKKLAVLPKEHPDSIKILKDLNVKLKYYKSDEFENKAFAVFDFCEWLDFILEMHTDLNIN